MHARYPLITLELKDMPTPDQIAALHSNQLDFGLVRLPVTGAGLETRLVLEESFVVALPDDHPLAAQPPIQPADLRGCPAFVLARRYAPGFHDEMLVALKHQGADLEIAQELGEFSTMLALVSAGLGIGVIPAEAATALAAESRRASARTCRSPGRHRLGVTRLDSAAKRALLGVMEHVPATRGKRRCAENRCLVVSASLMRR